MRRYHSGMFRRRLAALLLACLMLPANGQSDGLPDLGEAAQADLPPAMEKRIGDAMMVEYRYASQFVDDAEVSGYINRLGQRLIDHIEGSRPDFEFFVLRDNTLNAFAMPGGFIGVHTGLIVAAQSESELAGVLAHEISHVTQRHLARMFSQYKQNSIPTLVAMALALLAAKSNPDIAAGSVAAVQAASVQNQLNYSRDYEREADRLGLQLLDRAGFDVRGMEGFFERLQKAGRLYENNAPGYLRTHPLTTERIADMGNRIQGIAYRQATDSLEFMLVKAKLRAMNGQARDAVLEFSAQLQEKKYSNEIPVQFGLAHAQLRAQNFAASQAALAELRRLKVQSPMVESLAALIQAKQGQLVAAEKTLRNALQRWPQERALTYALIEVLQSAQQHDTALRLIAAELELTPEDIKLYALRAQSHAAQGKRLLQHRAQAEVYALQGLLVSAILQLQMAQQAPDGDFFEYSQVEARLRELKQRQAEELKDKKK